MPQPFRGLLLAFSLALVLAGCSERKQAGPPADSQTTAADEVTSPAAAEFDATEPTSSGVPESAQ